ncbi:hypothetical protein TbrSNM41_24580 (plasmid) [Thermus brockianus]|uniref:Uncharacterized protein n=2 Tax=Thermus brockianus TaxID=56956 RepID=A0ABN6NJD8_THEBO|nr:hypothetical protein TbrSNM41_24580 [Thermus brockianus]
MGMARPLRLAVFLLLAGLACGQGLGEPLGADWTAISEEPQATGTAPGPLGERPPLEGLLGPLPEGYQGFSLSVRLLLWSVPWTFAGALGGLVAADPFWWGFWLTNALWASVDGAIALVGLLSPEPDRAWLRDILYLNAALDLLYIAGGLWLASKGEARLQGAGWAVVLQGGWLLLFDLYHAVPLGE